MGTRFLAARGGGVCTWRARPPAHSCRLTHLEHELGLETAAVTARTGRAIDLGQGRVDLGRPRLGCTKRQPGLWDSLPAIASPTRRRVEDTVHELGVNVEGFAERETLGKGDLVDGKDEAAGVRYNARCNTHLFATLMPTPAPLPPHAITPPGRAMNCMSGTASLDASSDPEPNMIVSEPALAPTMPVFVS